MSPRSILRARSRSLRAPTLAALALIATVVASMFASMVVTVHSLETMSKAGRRTTEMTQDSLQLERVVVDLETGVRGYLLTDDEHFLEPYERGRVEIAQRLAELDRLSPPTMRGHVATISRDLNAYVCEYTEPLVHGTARPSVLAATTEGKARLDQLRAEFARLSAAQQSEVVERRAQSQA